MARIAYESLDLSGKRFGRLVVEAITDDAPGYLARWSCRCDCGTVCTVKARYLTNGETKSCGCLQWELRYRGNNNRTHGRSKTPEYQIWNMMNQRCTNPNNMAYPRYGGKGITVCDRWRASFLDFMEDMGPRPSPKHQLDRYPDQNGNYEPGNVRWATPTEQQRNRTNNRLVTCFGETLTLVEWAERTGFDVRILSARLLLLGWEPEKALTQPLKKLPKRKK